jgi:apolipoprotein N-acyltransferase
MLRKMISLAPAVLSAVLLSLSFSSFNFWLPAWFGLIPLFVSLENKSLSRSFFTAYLCGVLFWCICVYWLVHVTLLGQAVLVFYLAVYFGAFGCLVYLSRRVPALFALFFIPAGWVLLEYARGYLFTGFPWALLGFSQYNNLGVIQLSDITGCWGVSFLLVLVNTGVYLFWRRRVNAKGFLACICVLFLSLGYGLYRLDYHGRQVVGRQVKISVVQGNIPQDLKWDSRASGAILDNYIRLTEEAARGRPDLIVWPEAAVPFFWGDVSADEEYRKIFSLAKEPIPACL